MVLFAGMYACFVLAFTFGGPIWPWDDARFIALVVLSVGLLIAFAVTQHYALFTTKTDRLFPCDLLKNLQLFLLWIAIACGGAGLFVAVYYIPLFFLFVHGESGTEAAIRLLPLICFYVAAILFAGYAMPRTGYPIVYYLVSGIFLTAGGAAMYTVTVDTPSSQTYGYSILVGIGLIASQAGYSVASHLVETERLADVIQFLNLSQGQSQMIGLLIGSAIFQSKAFDGIKNVLDGQGFTNEEIRGAIAGSRSKVLGSISPELRSRCINVLVATIADIWIMVIAAGALLTVCSFFLSRKRF